MTLVLPIITTDNLEHYIRVNRKKTTNFVRTINMLYFASKNEISNDFASAVIITKVDPEDNRYKIL